MLDNIANILQRECKLHQGDKLLVGVSGGPDSLCLLNLLYNSGFNLIAAHVNHQLRPEADHEAEVVRQFAAGINIEFISTKIDVNTFADKYSLSIEAAARRLRYSYLFGQAERWDAVAVLVAHTADDQIETILMHLLRGSGLNGLRGMEHYMLPNPWSDHIPLVRPLLTSWREDIQKYLAKNEIEPVIDQSNLDTTYFRNRLRHELLPILERYNPSVRQNLMRVSQILRDDYSVLQQIVEQAWEVNLARIGPGYLALNRLGVLVLPLSIQRYLLRKAISQFLPGLHDVDFDCIERGLSFLAEAKTGGQINLMAGVWLIREGNLFWLASSVDALPMTEYPTVAPGEYFSLQIPSTLLLNNGWQLQAVETPDLASAISDSLSNSDPYHAWVDGEKLEFPLIIRCRKAGDRIQPIGMQGHSIKVSDLMINLKIPKRARRTWPLVCSGSHIIWIPGYRLSHWAQVEAGSRSVVYLTLSRNLSA